MTTKAMPKKPYNYAAYKHNMTRPHNVMLGDVLREWRKVNNVSPSTLAFVATTIAESAGLPVKLTVQDIMNYEEGKWVKAKRNRKGEIVVPGHYDPTKRCQPKSDKLMLLVAATGLTPEQLTGYNPNAVNGVFMIHRGPWAA